MTGALVLSGDGINCEQETAEAARFAGFTTRVLHVNDLLKSGGKELASTRLLVLPGGFSFGDELGSGKILALKLKHGLGETLRRFLETGGAALGICNGFQVLVRLGVFGPGVALTQNEQGHFLDRWVGLEITGKSIFTDAWKAKGITRLELPVRHGEGRLVPPPEAELSAVLRYEEDINGAWRQTAGLSAFDGRVLGLMPHPEAFWTEELHPWGNASKVPLGVGFFSNAYAVLTKGSR